jgi:RNA polymerase sigma factor (sigma-70 family)
VTTDDSGKPPKHASGETSRWTLILRAQGSGSEARVALGELVRRYERFVLRLIRYFKHPPDLTEEDLKQEFIVRLLTSKVDQVDENRGSFRAWLGWKIRGFLSDEWDKWRRRERTRSLSFDIAVHDDPERFMAAAFAWETVLAVLARLRDEAPDPKRFEALQQFLPGPALDLAPYAPVAQKLGITATHLAKLVCELRADFKRLLYEYVRDSLDPDDPAEPAPVPPTAPKPPPRPVASDAVEREMRTFYRSLSETPSVVVILEEA